MKFGLLGNHISYSLSPILHHHINRLYGDQDTYDLLDAKDDLASCLKKINKENYHGFNVTIPYKETLYKQVASLSDEAKIIGSVNTINVQDGQWVGYNTDGKGFSDALKAQGLNLSNLRVLLIGAGGAARALAFELMQEGVKTLLLYNRSKTRRNHLFIDINTHFKRGNMMILDDYQGCVVDVVINATPLGGTAYPNDLPCDLDKISCDHLVDIVYRPHETLLIKQAKALGIKVYYGIDMLIYQAIRAQEIWRQAPLTDDQKQEICHVMYREIHKLDTQESNEPTP